MTKEELLKKLDGAYNSVQLRGWVGALPSESDYMKPKPIKLKVGDVFMHVVFKHPIVLVKKTKGKWVCLLLTTDSNCPVIVEQCISRFFHNSYLTSNVIIMNELMTKYYMGVYDNTPHLKKVFNKIKMIIQ